MEVKYDGKRHYKAGNTGLVYWLRSRGEKLKKSGSEWEWSHQGERVTVRHNVWFDQYTQLGEVVLCLDNDAAGHKDVMRIARELLDEWEVEVSAHFPERKDLE